MRKKRYEILLPLRFSDGLRIPLDLLDETREELVAQFGALSLQPNALQGIWIHEGKRHEDDLRRIVVNVEDAPEVHQFFVAYKAKLLERFQQLEIYIVSYPVDIL
jgi:hypothetical protein